MGPSSSIVENLLMVVSFYLASEGLVLLLGLEISAFKKEKNKREQDLKQAS